MSFKWDYNKHIVRISNLTNPWLCFRCKQVKNSWFLHSLPNVSLFLKPTKNLFTSRLKLVCCTRISFIFRQVNQLGFWNGVGGYNILKYSTNLSQACFFVNQN